MKVAFLGYGKILFKNSTKIFLWVKDLLPKYTIGLFAMLYELNFLSVMSLLTNSKLKFFTISHLASNNPLFGPKYYYTIHNL